MQTIYGERDRRAGQRALRVEAARAICMDVALMLTLIGALVVAGVFK